MLTMMIMMMAVVVGELLEVNWTTCHMYLIKSASLEANKEYKRGKRECR